MSIPGPGAFGRPVGDPQVRYTVAGRPTVRFVLTADAVRGTPSGADAASVWTCTAWD